jgi:hypothetical protein
MPFRYNERPIRGVRSFGGWALVATSNQQPATSNQQPATSNQQPATSNQQLNVLHTIILRDA